jgi:methionyl-tRNA synthetase
MCAINALKVALYPYLPHSSQKIHGFLGYGGNIEDAAWVCERPDAGTKLPAPEPLFKKIETESVEGEARLTA